MSSALSTSKPYVILENDAIGHGSFGKVMRALWKETGEPVVVKIGSRSTLRQEYELLSSLTGEVNIVQVRYYEEDPMQLNNCRIVMEQAPTSLDKMMRRVPYRNGLPPVDIIKFVSDLSTAYSVLVGKKIAHRDIKPHNVLVFGCSAEHTKSQFLFKLCDFGFSKALESTNEACMTVGGTQPFLHPAILKEYIEHPKTFKMNTPYMADCTDLWSIGVTISFAMTGKIPFPIPENVHTHEELYGKRPEGCITAVLADQGFKHYRFLQTEDYPLWLQRALCYMIAQLFDHPSKQRFAEMAVHLSTAPIRKIVLLPAFHPTTYAQLDVKLFDGGAMTLNEVCGLPGSVATTILSSSGIHPQIVGKVIDTSSIRGETLLVWNELCTTLPSINPKEVVPIGRSISTHEPPFLEIVQNIFNLHVKCSDVIEAFRLAVHIINVNSQQLAGQVEDMGRWVGAVERNEKVAYSMATIAAGLKPGCKVLLDQLAPAKKETKLRTDDLRGMKVNLVRVHDDIALWPTLDQRPIHNADDAMESLRKAKGHGFDYKWAITMRTMTENRLDSLRRDCEARLTQGVGATVRELIRCAGHLQECKRKLRETIELVHNVLTGAQDSVRSYMSESGIEEAVVRKNLTNAIFVRDRVNEELEKQQVLLAKINSLQGSLDMAALRESVMNISLHSASSSEASNSMVLRPSNGLQ